MNILYYKSVIIFSGDGERSKSRLEDLENLGRDAQIAVYALSDSGASIIFKRS